MLYSGAEGLAGCRDGTVSAAAGRHLRDSGDTEEGRQLGFMLVD